MYYSDKSDSGQRLHSEDITMFSLSEHESPARILSASTLSREIEMNIELLRNVELYGDLSVSSIGERMEMSISNSLEALVDRNILFEIMDDSGDTALDFERNLVG